MKICCLAAFAALGFFSVHAEGTVSVRDFGAIPNDGKCDREAINQAIDAAVKQVPATVVFEAGTYNLTEPVPLKSALISISGVSNLTLLGQVDESGTPATRLERNVQEMKNDLDVAAMVRMSHCSNLTVKNMVSDNVPGFTSSGKITNVDRANDTVEVEVFEGLPHFDGMRCYSANSWDLKTRELIPVPALTIGVNKAAFSHTWKRVSGANDRVYRIQGMKFADRVEVGQGISWHFYVVGKGYQFFAAGCENLTFENVHIYNTRGIAIAMQNNRDLTFSGVEIRPEGAVLAAGARDAFHLVCNDGDLLVEDCYVKGVRWDPFNIKSKFCEITEISDARTFTCTVRTGGTLMPTPGSLLTFWVGDEPFEIPVASEEWLPGVSKKDDGRPARSLILRLAEDLPSSVSVGSFFTPQAWNFDKALIRNTTIEGNCGRAILYQGENLYVENCTFNNNAYANLALGPINELEGGFVRKAVIENSRFINSTWDAGNLFYGTISLYQANRQSFDDEPYNEQILIRNNVFEGINYLPNAAGIDVANAQDVTISGNRFKNCSREVFVHSDSTKSITVE